MADLFDLVRAAPPPEKIRPSPIPKRSRTISPIPSPASPIWSDNSVNNGKADTTIITTANVKAALTTTTAAAAADNENANITITTTIQSSKRAVVRIKRFSLQETSDYYDNNNDDGDADGADNEIDITKLSTFLSNSKAAINARNCLTKTKAQQKQFDDDLPMSSNSSDLNTTINDDNDDDHEKQKKTKKQKTSKNVIDKSTKKTVVVKSKNSPTKKPNKMTNKKNANKKELLSKCCVRLKRLNPSFIADCIAGRKKHKSSLTSKLNNSGGAAAKNKKKHVASKPNSSSSTTTTMHFKFTPVANRFKGFRSSTPPFASTPKSPKRSKLFNNSKLVKKYGGRVFRSYVRMQRCKHPVAMAFEANERSRKSRRLNLSVSFRDAVEIIGVGAGDGSVPTRLTKVQNGKVVDCVALDQTSFAIPVPQSALSSSLSSATSPMSSLSGKHRNGRKRSLNDKSSIDGIVSGRLGAKVARRSTGVNSLPLKDMTHLRISNDEGEDDDNEEYIVPNDLPECKPSTSLNLSDLQKNTSLTTTTTNAKAKPKQRRVLKSPPPTKTKKKTSSPLSKKSNAKQEPKKRNRKLITTTTLSAQSSKESSPVVEEISATIEAATLEATTTASAATTTEAKTTAATTRTTEAATTKATEAAATIEATTTEIATTEIATKEATTIEAEATEIATTTDAATPEKRPAASSSSAEEEPKENVTKLENKNLKTATTAIDDDDDDDNDDSKMLSNNKKSTSPSIGVDTVIKETLTDKQLVENDSSIIITEKSGELADGFDDLYNKRRPSEDSVSSFSTPTGLLNGNTNVDIDETKQNGDDNDIDENIDDDGVIKNEDNDDDNNAEHIKDDVDDDNDVVDQYADNNDDNADNDDIVDNKDEDTKKTNDTVLEEKNESATENVATTKSATATATISENDDEAEDEQYHDSNSIFNKTELNDTKNTTTSSIITFDTTTTTAVLASSISNAVSLSELDAVGLTDDVLTIGLSEQGRQV